MQRPTPAVHDDPPEHPAYDRAVRSARALRTKIHRAVRGSRAETRRTSRRAPRPGSRTPWRAGCGVFIAPSCWRGSSRTKLRRTTRTSSCTWTAHLNPALVRGLPGGPRCGAGRRGRCPGWRTARASWTPPLCSRPCGNSLWRSPDARGAPARSSPRSRGLQRPADERVVARARLVQDLARLKNSEVGKLPVVHALTNKRPRPRPRGSHGQAAARGPGREPAGGCGPRGAGQELFVVSPVGNRRGGHRGLHRGRPGPPRAQRAGAGRVPHHAGRLQPRLEPHGTGLARAPAGLHLSPDDVAERLVRAVARDRRRPTAHRADPGGAAAHSGAAARARGVAAHPPAALAGVPYEAMQALAELTAPDPGPHGALPALRAGRPVPPRRGAAPAAARRRPGGARPGHARGPVAQVPAWSTTTRPARHDLAKSLLLELTTLSTAMRHVA
ncbi:hypothetical protein QJS66_20925 [Kocuria rhizophila]|nr:hypothetical protein QJS66_20925 [Kocuria rhizophila]